MRLIVIATCLLLSTPLFAAGNPTPTPVVQQAVATTTSTSGQFSVTFARPFNTSTPVVQVGPLGGGTAPQVAICQLDSITNPTTVPVVNGHCSVTRAITGGLAGDQNAVSAVAAGLSVMVSAADRTQ